MGQLGAGGSDVGRRSENESRCRNDKVGETRRITEVHSATRGQGVERKQLRESMEEDLRSEDPDGGCDGEIDIGIGGGNVSDIEPGAGAKTESRNSFGASTKTEEAGSSTTIPIETIHDDNMASQNMSTLPPYVESLSTPSSFRPSSPPRVQPREDEGNETLPSYSCSIKIAAVFHRKMEFDSAVHRARDRNWYKVFVELQGTALRIYKCRTTSVFQTVAKKENPDMPASVRAGDLVGSYTLQYGDVGIAADYKKRRYVIRLRVEADQFLLSCIELHTFVTWLELLAASISLSPPLDQRTLPQEYSLPRRDRQHTENQTVAANDNSQVAQQQPIVRVQPHMAAEVNEEREAAGGGSMAASEPMTRRASQISETGNLSRATSAISATTFSSSSTVSLALSQVSNPLSRSSTQTPCSSSSFCSPSTSTSTPATTPSASQSNLNPSSSKAGKWSPEHTWSPQYDLLYAKRCMAILLRRSPRKTNFVIVKDREFLVNWDSGRVRRCSPPEYGELNQKIGRGHGRGWAIGRGAVLVGVI